MKGLLLFANQMITVSLFTHFLHTEALLFGLLILRTREKVTLSDMQVFQMFSKLPTAIFG